MENRRLFFVLILLCLFLGLHAQEMSVISFRNDPSDLTANTEGTTVKDQNGEKCALIKLITTQRGFAFDVGMLGVRKIEEHPGEIWVYVPRGVKRISISHASLGSLRGYDLGFSLESAKTYIMELKIQGGSVVDGDDVQCILFRVSPSKAVVKIHVPSYGEMKLPCNDSVVSPYLKFGTYSYAVEADEYRTSSGTVKVCDPDRRHTVDVKLVPAFGFLYVPDNELFEGAKVTVDGKEIGYVPVREKLFSGSHSVVITRSKYKPLSTDITIEDGKIITFGTELVPNFAVVTIAGVDGSEIWINGKYEGMSPWTGELEYGRCTVECRKKNHRTTTRSIDLAPGSAVSFQLSKPEPICGSLTVKSSVYDADVYIDGTLYGKTPLSVERIMIGNHAVKIKKSGYVDYATNVFVSEGEEAGVVAQLSSKVPVTLRSSAPDVQVMLDGVRVSDISSVTALSIGQHRLQIYSPDYMPFSESFIVTKEGTNSFFFRPKPKLTTKEYTVNGVSFKMVAVQGGTFEMGRKAVVTLSSFLIGETEVTQRLWIAVMGSNPSNFKGNSLPVESVSWYDCQTFIKKLNALTGQNFRLPTEAEWEFAARGGNKSMGYKYSGGNDVARVAWYAGNSRNSTSSVACKAPNELGLFDMSGNVYEWCSDWSGNYKKGNVSDPQGADNALERIARGGCYCYDASNCLVKNRYQVIPKYRRCVLGLRLAM